ncbi:MAG TPA: response regulator [Acidobacteriaceae bacterium]|nr:response regulator [Acidobacteriaceae bacterium]
MAAPTYRGGGGKRVRTLVVSGQPRTLNSIIKFLGQEGGFDIVGQCRSGWDGIRMAVDQLPDLVIADFTLEDMTGAAVSKALKALPKAPDVIVVSSTASKDYMLISMQAGADAYVLMTELEQIPLALRHSESTTRR